MFLLFIDKSGKEIYGIVYNHEETKDNLESIHAIRMFNDFLKNILPKSPNARKLVPRSGYFSGQMIEKIKCNPFSYPLEETNVSPFYIFENEEIDFEAKPSSSKMGNLWESEDDIDKK